MFSPVTLGWKGEDYVIPANQIMRAIATVEEVVTMHELMEYGKKGKAPLAKLAMAFGAMMRFAGCKITDEEAYAAMFSADSQLSMISSINILLHLMVPPDPKPEEKASPTGNEPKADNKSSKKHSKRLLASAGAHPQSSGE